MKPTDACKGKGKSGYKGGKGDYKGDKGKGKGKGKFDNKGGKGGGKHGESDNYNTGKGKGGDSCLYCGKPGHWKRDCRKLKWDKERNTVRLTSSTGGDMQTSGSQHHVPPPPSAGGTVSVPQSSAASNASTGTFWTASNVRRVSGATVYRIDEDQKPYDLTIFALEEQVLYVIGNSFPSSKCET